LEIHRVKYMRRFLIYSITASLENGRYVSQYVQIEYNFRLY